MKISRLFDFRPKEEALDIPAGRMSRLRQSYQRRLCDQLEEVFHRACVENDVRTAAGLYAVLEDMCTRRSPGRGSERRITEESLQKARDALDRCRALQAREQAREQEAATPQPKREEWKRTVQEPETAES